MSTFPPLSDAPVTAPPPPSLPTEKIIGRFISLVPLSAVHIDELYEQSHGDATRESVWQFLPYGSFPNAVTMRECYTALSSENNPKFYAVSHHSDNKLAGIVSYLNIHPAAYSIEIGHIWHAADRQRGVANSEAAFLLIDTAFALGYRRLEWKCNALNRCSRLAALRLGFAFEGVFRQHLVCKGKNRDTAWFSLLDKEWQTARQNFVKWFDDPSLSLTEMNRPLVAWSLPTHDLWQ